MPAWQANPLPGWPLLLAEPCCASGWSLPSMLPLLLLLLLLVVFTRCDLGNMRWASDTKRTARDKEGQRTAVRALPKVRLVPGMHTHALLTSTGFVNKTRGCSSCRKTTATAAVRASQGPTTSRLSRFCFETSLD
jgi:hypothetical protein